MCVRTKEFHCLSAPPDYVPNRLNLRSMLAFTCSPSVSGWNTYSPVVGYCKAAGQSDDLRVTASLRVERQYLYWLYNFVFAVFLIVSLAPVAFSISADSIGERMGIILTLLLTIVTFKFVIGSEAPKTSTMTLLDKYIFIAYLMLLLVVAQTLVCVHVDETWWSFLNWSSTIVLCFFWLALHVWIVISAFSGSFYISWDEMTDFGADDSIHAAVLIEPKNITLPIN